MSVAVQVAGTQVVPAANADLHQVIDPVERTQIHSVDEADGVVRAQVEHIPAAETDVVAAYVLLVLDAVRAEDAGTEAAAQDRAVDRGEEEQDCGAGEGGQCHRGHDQLEETGQETAH